MGKEVVYVSGRARAAGEMNGKSGNMNNALNQIYPKEYAIPGNELVCVFDADQVAKRDFFLKTLPYFDAGKPLLPTVFSPLPLFFTFSVRPCAGAAPSHCVLPLCFLLFTFCISFLVCALVVARTVFCRDTPCFEYLLLACYTTHALCLSFFFVPCTCMFCSTFVSYCC